MVGKDKESKHNDTFEIGESRKGSSARRPSLQIGKRFLENLGLLTTSSRSEIPDILPTECLSANDAVSSSAPFSATTPKKKRSFSFRVRGFGAASPSQDITAFVPRTVKPIVGGDDSVLVPADAQMDLTPEPESSKDLNLLE